MATNMATIRFDSANAGYEMNIEKIRKMSEEQLGQLDELLSKKILEIREHIGIVKVLQGKQVSEKLFEKLETKAELVDAQLSYRSDTKKRIDVKTNKVVEYQVYSSPEAVMVSQANDKVTSAETIENIKYTLNKYSLRESHGNGYIKTLGAVRDVIKVVRKERLDAEYSAKKAKLVVIGQIGRQLMAEMPVQPVEQIIPEAHRAGGMYI